MQINEPREMNNRLMFSGKICLPCICVNQDFFSSKRLKLLCLALIHGKDTGAAHRTEGRFPGTRDRNRYSYVISAYLCLASFCRQTPTNIWEDGHWWLESTLN